MAISTLLSYDAKTDAPFQTVMTTKDSIGPATEAQWYSLFAFTPGAGAVPTTPAVCTSALAGSLGQINASTTQRLARVACRAQQPFTLVLVDRLSHMGGLSGIVFGTPQAVNTQALTRYTSGVGVWAIAEIYTIIGGTVRLCTISYTNQAGVSGQVSPLINIGGLNNREQTRAILFNTASGDVGIRSVESITINTGSTGTVGNFGITLFKPLWKARFIGEYTDVFEFDAVRHRGGCMPEILPDACLHWMIISTGVTGIVNPVIKLIED
jgi:hypothetical protein